MQKTFSKSIGTKKTLKIHEEEKLGKNVHEGSKKQGKPSTCNKSSIKLRSHTDLVHQGHENLSAPTFENHTDISHPKNSNLKKHKEIGHKDYKHLNLKQPQINLKRLSERQSELC